MYVNNGDTISRDTSHRIVPVDQTYWLHQCLTWQRLAVAHNWQGYSSTTALKDATNEAETMSFGGLGALIYIMTVVEVVGDMHRSTIKGSERAHF